MTVSVETEELFIFALVLAGYVPVIRAYVRQQRALWLFVGYTALLVGRGATILEDFFASGLWVVAEHGVGVALAGACFLAHFTVTARRGRDRADLEGDPTDRERDRTDDRTSAPAET
jgi:hypothetical protein